MIEQEFIENLPAFPHEHRVGMTMRDYFAAKVMQGLLTRPRSFDIEEYSALAYRTADAMLKAREA